MKSIHFVTHLRRPWLIYAMRVMLSGVMASGLIWFFGLNGGGYGARPNVLLISIDPCRADHLSRPRKPRNTGNTRDPLDRPQGNATPNIDAISHEGILFRNALSPVPLTLPAHSSMLTGTIPPYHGVHDNHGYRLADANVTLAERLKEVGYTTGAIVSAFVMDSQFGLDQGFDHYHDQFDDARNTTGMLERRGEEVTRYGLRWMEEQRNGPFFLFLHYYDPHAVYAPPEPFASEFLHDPYAGEIAYVDHCVGQVVTRLKELELYDSTLIVVTSDHGEMLGEHGESTHSFFIYQNALRVPLIMKLPGQHTAQMVEETVGLIDVLPTICRVVGIRPPSDVQGVDLTRYLENTSIDPARIFYCETVVPTRYDANPLFGVVSGDWKYIQSTRPELYDLTSDPFETENLIIEEQSQVRVMQKSLNEMLAHQPPVDNPESRLAMDEPAVRRLEALGYVAGNRDQENFALDDTRDDAKDLIAFHSAYANQLNPLIHEGRYEEARKICQQLLKQRPDFAEGHFKMAVIAKGLNDPQTAMTHFREALRVNPDHAHAHYNLGLIFHFKSDFEKAVDHYRQALKVDERFSEAHNGWANTLFATGQIEESIKHYTEALVINPDYADAHSNLGIAYHSQSKFDQAIKHYRHTLTLDRGNARVCYALAEAYTATGDLEQAVTYANKALQFASDGERNGAGAPATKRDR